MLLVYTVWPVGKADDSGCSWSIRSGPSERRTTVDALGLYGLACRKGEPWHQLHSHMNDVIWRALKRNTVVQAGAAADPIRSPTTNAPSTRVPEDTHIVFHGVSRSVKRRRHWTRARTWKTHHRHHWGHRRNSLSVSTSVFCFTTTVVLSFLGTYQTEWLSLQLFKE